MHSSLSGAPDLARVGRGVRRRERGYEAVLPRAAALRSRNARRVL